MKKVSVFVIFLLVAATLAGCSHPDCMGPNIVMEIQSFEALKALDVLSKGNSEDFEFVTVEDVLAQSK